MSYAAEPYAQFVDDLVTSLTGGVVRRRFVFLPDAAPFALAPTGAIVPSSLKVYGQVERSYRRFERDVDYTVSADNSIAFRAQAGGVPAAGAVWPDAGTAFFANFDEKREAGAAPQLSDRNPGSVARLLAESFAREYAVLSKQLEGVYEAGFIDTAKGRDLDQLVALVGVERRTRTFAAGTVVFSAIAPASADVAIQAGTRVSTAEPPFATFETTDAATLHRGTLSAEVPIRAIASGAPGVVLAQTIRVIHRPMLGIASVQNPQATSLGAADESDEALRQRARRALQAAGRATNGALIGALAALPGVREKDILLDEDPLLRPGVVVLKIAAELDDESSEQALELIERTRPAGVRIIHQLDTQGTITALGPGANEVADESGDVNDSLDAGAELFRPLVVKAILVPAVAGLTAAERNALKLAGETALGAVVADAGVGEPLVYNRAVAALIAIPGVQDVALEVWPKDTPLAARHRNVFPGRGRRPTISAEQGGIVEVRVAGKLLALDVNVAITLQGAGTLGDPQANMEAARLAVAAQLRDGVASLAQLTVPALRGLIVDAETYTVSALTYRGEYVSDGVRLKDENPAVTLTALESAWVRSVLLLGAGA